MLLYTKAVNNHADTRGKLEPWQKLFCWIAGKVRTGDKLEGRQADALLAWMTENDLLDVPTSEFYTVQFPRQQAADGLFGGGDVYVKRALDKLLEYGLLTVLAKGRKGFATLYGIAPIPLQNSEDYVGENKHLHNPAACVGESDIPLHSNRDCVGGNTPTQWGVSPTQSGQYPYTVGEIPLHSESRDLGKREHNQLNQVFNQGGAKSPAPSAAGDSLPVCPTCSEPMVRTSSTTPGGRRRIYRCDRCGETAEVEETRGAAA